ncbi:hypothetical protein [Halolamina litorea]|uniref:Halobacterial output domain-containing protein n=1 Tax=Halolamina litorea TaxID=1515593 RepID=A0ABD6BWM2_9EURY|nr:hypothetical protein [Halolamina litorea]
MALFDDEDEQDDTTDSGGWGVDESAKRSGDVDESADATGDPAVDDGSEPVPLADLDTATIADDDPHGTLKRAVDPDAGVVIYAYKNGNAGGLSAVPLSETDLVDDEGE